jgi:hypothetical protein
VVSRFNQVFYELEHPKWFWFCPADGWRVWEPPATTMAADAHRQLACSAYASPSTTRWIMNCNGGPTTWVPVCCQSGAGQSAEVDLAADARGGSAALEVEQCRNNIAGYGKHFA